MFIEERESTRNEDIKTIQVHSLIDNDSQITRVEFTYLRVLFKKVKVSLSLLSPYLRIHHL